jgi:short subunit dehydrogenase-like uncharacterized protein
MEKSTRPFDVILLGATGFTGKFVADYLLRQYGVNQGLRWAMAGRSLEKLKKLQTELGAEEVPVLVADNHDRASLDTLVAQTRVVCSTVGPYAKYGSELVAACVEAGTDYCDLTGEVQWMRRMIDAHQARALEKGVRIVHTCGFDSIPSDMGTFFLQREVQARFGQYCQQVKLRVAGGSGGLSGGTIASLMNVLDELAKDPSLKKIIWDPYILNPAGERHGKDGPARTRGGYDADARSYVGPFAMEFINAPVVRRAHALRGYPYGKDFQYDEAILTGRGFMGWLTGWGLSLGTRLMPLLGPGSPLRWILNRFLPQPGEGPSEEKRKNGFFKMKFYGKLSNGTLIRTTVVGDQDPGYGSTSKMLGECAVCLALDQEKTPKVAGFLPPSVAMGEVLLARLQEKAGLTFSWNET